MLKHSLLFLIGGIIYFLIEICFRGYSHWTMFLLGGCCFVLIGLVNEIIPWEMEIWKQGLIGSGIITSLEFLTGIIVNIILKWNVWDYSETPFNIMGQICLPFSFLWFFISLAAIILDDYFRYIFFKEEKPKYYLFNKKGDK